MSAPPVKIAVVGMALVALVLMTLGVAHVGRRQEVIRHGYDLSRALEDLSRQQQDNRRLRLEKSVLTNPERIRRLAESLGMTQPRPEQIRVIRPGARTAARDEARTAAQGEARTTAREAR